jgi:hypothetical protein
MSNISISNKSGYKNYKNYKNTDKNKNIIVDLEDYMFIPKNMDYYVKDLILNISIPKASNKYIEQEQEQEKQTYTKKRQKQNQNQKPNKEKEMIYKIRQRGGDSLFWCFYIMKNGFFNYEMEINNQYFTVEKAEKYKYIEIFRKNKDKLKLHKIKPFTELEDDLANKERISVKTFFALCIVENINAMLVNRRKVYEVLCSDDTPTWVVHRNSESYEHWIELDPTEDTIKKYKETYLMMNGFDMVLKSMTSYKLEELIDLCVKLNIDLKEKEGGKKLTKKDIYEMLVMQY